MSPGRLVGGCDAMSATDEPDSGAILDCRQKAPRDARAPANLDLIVLARLQSRAKLVIRHSHYPTLRIL